MSGIRNRLIVIFMVSCLISLQVGAFSPMMQKTSVKKDNIAMATTNMEQGNKQLPMMLSGATTGMLIATNFAVAGQEVEMADLPPMWVPAVFGVVLLAGVGLLTGSLGDVMMEESSLGMQSGARARKEIERSKSSYFKK